MSSFSIEEIDTSEFHLFMKYLSKHLEENGTQGELFQPVSPGQFEIGAELEKKFKAGFLKKIGEPGWRKLWLAKSPAGQIAGHIDIRSRLEPNTAHRVLLGMGVDSGFRKRSIGEQLLTYVIDYCRAHPKIDWLDLEVLSNNFPAFNLYKKLNFEFQYNCIDMFRIEGKSYDYTRMTLQVG